MATSTAVSFRSGHGSFIQDIAYNYYGSRLASCSVDFSIQIYQLSEGSQWTLTQTIPRAHDAPVNRVNWCHPEFGSVIASCSGDQNIHIWEETTHSTTLVREFIKRASLVDSKDEVLSVVFAPQHLGLVIAACSRDGMVRVYEALDVMKLSMWNLKQEFMVDRGGVTCLDWNHSPFSPQQLIVGTDQAGAQIWENSVQNNGTSKWEFILQLDVRIVYFKV